MSHGPLWDIVTDPGLPRETRHTAFWRALQERATHPGSSWWHGTLMEHAIRAARRIVEADLKFQGMLDKDDLIDLAEESLLVLLDRVTRVKKPVNPDKPAAYLDEIIRRKLLELRTQAGAVFYARDLPPQFADTMGPVADLSDQSIPYDPAPTASGNPEQAYPLCAPGEDPAPILAAIFAELLDPAEIVLMTLYRLAGRNCREIGALLGIQWTTVRQRAHRAEKKIFQNIDRVLEIRARLNTRP